MRILQFSVEGFRSLRAIHEWKPGPLNVLIGPNASGKSNVLKAIHFLAASAQGKLSKQVQTDGGMGSLLWDGLESELRFSVLCSPLNPPDLPKDSLDYTLRLDRLGGGDDFKLGLEQLSDFRNVHEGLSDEPFPCLTRTGSDVQIYLDQAAKLIKIAEADVPPSETILGLAKGPFVLTRTLSGFRSELAAFTVYQDFNTGRDASVRQSSVTRHETRVDADGQNLVSVLHTLYTGNRDFKNEINDAMTAGFGSDFEELVFAPGADGRIQLRLRWKSLRREQSAADLSDGTLRFLFLLTVLASPDPAPLIAIDEPETGLHPSMLPIVAEYAVQASKNAQVILTTHSPQLLDAFTGTIPQTTVVQRVDGETRLVTLPEAKLQEWLKDYSLGALHRSGELEEMAS